jgi:hypothetical protein
MSQLNTEEVGRYLDLLATHRRTLAIYIKQQAAIGQAFSPPALVPGISEARDEIARIKGALRSAGVEVPDSPDDESHPMPPVIVAAGPGRTRRRQIVGALGLAALGLALVVAFLQSRAEAPRPGVSHETPAATQVQPAPEATAAPALSATPAPPQAPPTEPQTLFSDDFSSGQAASWSGNSAEWSTIPDGAGFVYQGQGLSAEADTAPPIALDLADYAVEVRFRVIQSGAGADAAPDLTVTLRMSSPAVGGCYGYGYAYYGAQQRVALARFGDPPCPLQFLGVAPLASEPGSWHTLRAEAQGDRLRLLVDGKLLLTATDSTLAHGSFYLSVANGSVVQFAQVRVVTIP